MRCLILKVFSRKRCQRTDNTSLFLYTYLQKWTDFRIVLPVFTLCERKAHCFVSIGKNVYTPINPNFTILKWIVRVSTVYGHVSKMCVIRTR